MPRRYLDREAAWRHHLDEIGFDVTSVLAYGNGRMIWVHARDRDPQAARPNLQVTDAWDDGNEAWSFGFDLAADGEQPDVSLSYDGERPDVEQICARIDAARC